MRTGGNGRTTTVTYDATGNRNNDSYTTGAGNQMTSDGTWNYTYDDEGNQTRKVRISDGVTWKYGYDNKNQLIHAQRETTDGGAIELEADYAYDVFKNRIEKTVDADEKGGKKVSGPYLTR